MNIQTYEIKNRELHFLSAIEVFDYLCNQIKEKSSRFTRERHALFFGCTEIVEVSIASNKI
jgi:hypothetical protein